MEIVSDTNHSIHFKNSQDLKLIPDNSVHLVVTSPPYPMISMWDELFIGLNPMIGTLIKENRAKLTFKKMNQELDKIWCQFPRIMVEGGIVCINIGDATRNMGDKFQLYPNHSWIINKFEDLNFQTLPSIIWRKETNKPNKFMGSGMLPVGAYVTLEHEHILIFRKGRKRTYSDIESKIRKTSTYFWEERNLWFSDLWKDLKGVTQKMKGLGRKRSGAYPFQLAFRLINMFSMIGDTILDPFLGTGTTTLAAMCLSRNSIGFEIDKEIQNQIIDVIGRAKDVSREIVKSRIEFHLIFNEGILERGKELKYHSENYGFKVMTRQETNILFPVVSNIEETEIGWNVKYSLNYL